MFFTDCFLVKFAVKIPTKSADFSANLSLKSQRNLTFFLRPIRRPDNRFFLLHSVASWKLFYYHGTTLRVKTYIFMLCGEFASTNQKHYQDLVVMRHQYGISVLVSQMSFYRETSGGFTVKCPLWGALYHFCLECFLYFYTASEGLLLLLL